MTRHRNAGEPLLVLHADADEPQDSPHQLASGTQVMARYNAKDPGPFLAKRFYAGRITRSNADGTYNINYDDGDTELNVPLRFIKVAGEAGAAEEDEVEDEEKHERVAIKVLSHLFHPGARLGSPDDVYVRLRYSDGTMNGGYYIPLEQLCASIKGPEILVKYCSTEHGQTLRGYVPPYVLSAGMPPTDVELAVGQGMTDASRCCALAYAKAAERVSQAEVERYARWCATHPTATETGWDRSDTDALATLLFGTDMSGTSLERRRGGGGSGHVESVMELEAMQVGQVEGEEERCRRENKCMKNPGCPRCFRHTGKCRLTGK